MKFVYDKQRGKSVPKEQAPRRPGAPVNVMRDQPGFNSPIDGTWLEGRKDIREHERKHNVTQVGNDVRGPKD